MGRKSKFDSAFKTKVFLDALKEKETLSELAKKYGIAPKQITEWKRECLEKSGSVFGENESESRELKSLKAENERLLKKKNGEHYKVSYSLQRYATYRAFGNTRGCIARDALQFNYP